MLVPCASGINMAKKKGGGNARRNNNNNKEKAVNNRAADGANNEGEDMEEAGDYAYQKELADKAAKYEYVNYPSSNITTLCIQYINDNDKHNY